MKTTIYFELKDGEDFPQSLLTAVENMTNQGFVVELIGTRPDRRN